MADKADMVRVISPATVANVGVGFDSCAFAVSMYNEFIFERTASGLDISGCPEEYRNADNMSYVTYRAVFEEVGQDVGGVKIGIKSGIPICRGLGSSAAMLIAGAVAANELLGCPLTRRELLDICMRIEPHPDNICACLYGGFTSSVKTGDDAEVFRSDVNGDLRFYALIPDFTVCTEKARAILPENVPLADAVSNISRAAILPRAFSEGNRGMISLATEDRLHQKYRSGLIDGFDDVGRAAAECGAYAYFISGAGPTCMAMSDEKDFAGKLAGLLKGMGKERRIEELSVDSEGTRVIGL